MAAPVPPSGPDILAAARTLLTPQRVPLDRDPVDPATLREDEATAARLRAQHAAHLRAHRAPQASRVLARLIRHETTRRARVSAEAVVPSLLAQLCDAVESSRGTGHRGAAGPHRSAIGLSAADLIGDIERVVGSGPRPTLHRRVWRWVRVHDTDPSAAAALACWVERARDVVDPPRPVTVVGACPHCRRTVVHVLDAGEWVRRPALQVDRDAGRARCIGPGCGATWDQAHMPLLARVLEQQASESSTRGAPAHTPRPLVSVRG